MGRKLICHLLKLGAVADVASKETVLEILVQQGMRT